jgi:hypothetical protein
MIAVEDFPVFAFQKTKLTRSSGPTNIKNRQDAQTIPLPPHIEFAFHENDLQIARSPFDGLSRMRVVYLHDEYRLCGDRIPRRQFE